MRAVAIPEVVDRVLLLMGPNGSGQAQPGQRELADRHRLTVPCGPVLLTGYSQGAQVTADVYQNGSTRNVLGVVLFGDPYFNPKDPAVDRGDYSRHPGRDGWFGARIRFGTEPGVVSRGRVISYCHDGDPVCQGPLPPQDWPAFLTYHNNYDRLNEPATAARFFAQLGS